MGSRTNVTMPRALFEAARTVARAERTNPSRLVRRLLLAHLAQFERAKARTGESTRLYREDWGKLSKRQVAKLKGLPWAQPKQLPLEVLSDGVSRGDFMSVENGERDERPSCE